MNAKQQGRLDGFFTSKPSTSSKNDDDKKGKSKGKAVAKDDKKGTKRKVSSIWYLCRLSTSDVWYSRRIIKTRLAVVRNRRSSVKVARGNRIPRLRCCIVVRPCPASTIFPYI